MLQRVVATFEYPVLFSRGCLDPANPSLRDAIAGREPERAHRALVAVDSGLIAARPTVTEELRRYLPEHSLLVVPGGETCKNDPAQLAAVQQAIFERGLDRHSCVVAVGGG